MQNPSEAVQPESKESNGTAESKDQSRAPHSRISRYDQFFDLRTLSTTLRKTHSNKSTKAKVGKKSALVVIREIDSRGRYEGTEVEIRSEQLFQLLLDLNEDADLWVKSRIPPKVDPKLFYFSHAGLHERLHQEKAKTDRDEVFISDVEVALEYIVEDYSNTTQEIRSLIDQEQISFNLLWALILPNSLVYRHEPFTEQNQILRAHAVAYDRKNDGTRYAVIVCDVIRDDGNSFGLSRQHIQIDDFQGLKKIRDLEAYPLKFHPERAAIQEKAVDRARRFIRVKQNLFETHGPAVRETENSAFETRLVKFFTYGRVMIDPSAFRMYNPHVSYNNSVHTHLDRDELNDEQYPIFSPILLGFCFGSKTWGGFAADRLVDIAWSEEAFNSLVLGAKQKELVLALTRQHVTRSKTFDDIIPGKGRGLVGLLCGPPGCGKTLTAEATAEYTRSPLYVVSAGELGTSPEEVDLRLLRTLDLAQRWNAVLLLDEAEVFLQARSGAMDLVRNALVSIFLRQLEYYQGILILTTNLISHIDPAFESRIHFCIHYSDLDQEACLKIWRLFFHKALGEVGMKSISHEDLNRLSALKLNGRQIKNAVSSAQSIALEANVPLAVEHVDRVLDVINDWNRAMKQARKQESRNHAVRTYSLSNEGVLIDNLIAEDGPASLI